jgi:uncharacterized protein YbjT (DUF2867 family)
MNLITGTTGMMGGAVLEEVRKRNRAVKVMYRNKEDAAKGPAGVAAVIGDYADKQSMRKAFEGIDALYLVCSPIPQLVELESNAIDACVEKGVQHVVLNSALGAEDYPKSFPVWHRKVEEKLKGSELDYTIIRPNSFMQNILAYFGSSIQAQGMFYSSMGDSRVSLIDVHDIATVAANVLDEPKKHSSKVYELNGPEALSYSDVAKAVSQVAGRQVQYINIPESAQEKAMLDQGMPEWLVTALLDLQKYYTEERKGGEVTDVLRELLKRAPITLDQYLTANKESFRAQAASA